MAEPGRDGVPNAVAVFVAPKAGAPKLDVPKAGCVELKGVDIGRAGAGDLLAVCCTPPATVSPG